MGQQRRRTKMEDKTPEEKLEQFERSQQNQRAAVNRYHAKIIDQGGMRVSVLLHPGESTDVFMELTETLGTKKAAFEHLLDFYVRHQKAEDR